MQIGRLAPALAAIALAAGPAAAQTPAQRADVRCVLVLNVVRDPAQRPQAVQATYYYLGKLAAAGLMGRLESLLETEGSANIQAAQIQAELTRCGTELQLRSTELGTAYKNLQAAHAPAAKPPAK